MNSFYTRSLIKAVLLFVSFQCFGQKDSSVKMNGGNPTFPSTVAVPANSKLKGSFSKTLFSGKNYRREWITPVSVPVLNLNTSQGGLEPVKEGGGKQTRSLQVENKNGQKWSLRSVEKFPEKAIPPGFKNTIVEKLVKDGISASYPYGALSMGILSKAAHVPFFKVELTYIPDDPVLGKFRHTYKNMLVLMEDKEPGEIVIEKEPGKDVKTISTEELVYELAHSNDNRVDQSAVLRARLLDNFVMDFDRHEGQWEWVASGSGKNKIYYPVPKDRDQVFFINQGMIQHIMRSKNILPELQGFEKKARNIKTFNRAVQNFDRYFLTGLSKDEWSKEIDEFLDAMTDSVIEMALHQQPQEIQKYSAEKIINTLKKRRSYFKKEMLQYYAFLARTVSIVGSNGPEQFSISKNEDGSVSVTGNKIDSLENISSTFYERRFDPHETKEIRIYGLEGDDKFVVKGEGSGIKIRMIGGPGNDQFINQGHGRKPIVYDVNFEQNSISGNGAIKNRISNDPQNNLYTRLGYRYSFLTPAPTLEYSTDGGLFLGIKLKMTTAGFRKDPFSTTHLLTGTRAINSSSYHIKYAGDLFKVFGNTDIQIRADVKLPTSRTHFFGLGNNTVFDQTKPGKHKYYLAHYELADVSLLARSTINPWLQIKYGAIYQYFKLSGKENNGKYISTLNSYPIDPDPKITYAGRSYAGGELRFEINTKNSLIIPTRGIALNAYGRFLGGLNKYSHNVTQTGGDLTLYTDFISKKKVVLATSFGASHIFGNYEFEQAQYLGFKQNLRGFRITRFGGRSRAYNNTELRIKIADINTYLFPASFGILAFNDVGRVWENGESSTAWHDGYGGGIWLAPVDRFVVTASLTASKEEKRLALVTFGFQF